jgi:hypothetical protein
MLFLLIQLAPYSSLVAAIRCSAMTGPSMVTFTAALTFFDGRVSAGGQGGLPHANPECLREALRLVVVGELPRRPVEPTKPWAARLSR